MGGIVNVAVRFKDGTTVCQERWTNNISYWLKRPALHEDEQAARDYLALVQNNDHVIDPGSPGSLQPVRDSEYGLVVIDYVTGTILDNNSYSGLGSFDPIFTGGENRAEAFEECAAAGRLRLRTREWAADSQTPIRDETGPLLTPEEALRVGEELFREAIEDRPSGRRSGNLVRRVMVIDRGDFTVERLPADDRKAMRRRLVEIGFPLTAEQGVNAHLKPTPRARKVTKQEETARRLFQEWKKTPGSGGKAFDGVRYEDVDETLRGKLMDGAAAYLCDEDSLPAVLETLG